MATEEELFEKMMNEFPDFQLELRRKAIEERAKIIAYNKSERGKRTQKKYYSKPEVKERRKKYYQEYYSRPDIKERMKKYNAVYHQTPEFKERNRERARKAREKNHDSK